MYRTESGIVINADVNGAGNILRKAYPYAYDGQDLSYLYRTTRAVGYTDLYPGAVSPVKQSYNGKTHSTGAGSRVRHACRQDTRMEYRLLWETKDERTPERKKTA